MSSTMRNRRLTLAAQERLKALVETSPAAIVTVNERGFVELARPCRRGLDEFPRHVLVVAQVPGVHPLAGGRCERTRRRLRPRQSDAPGFLGDLDWRLVGQPADLIRQQYVLVMICICVLP